ncbi:NlpC/P60 family peptidoglycan endopeptidase RipA [Mycolicibacterium brumae]|uniref:Peptidase M23 n=1 Tax=Mycolicibacterium brumae TaxID=85968 RepID=A0A2G5PB15_9MYCO|nr:peptidase M23 [Mycolicibacterium brumae]
MRLIHGVVPLLASTLTLVTAGPVAAAPGPDDLATLITKVAEANQKLSDVGAQVQTEQEKVNKSLVDLQGARKDAESAQQEVQASQQAVRDSDGAIDAAQARFDEYAVATYMSGPSDSLLTASDPDQMISAVSDNETIMLASKQVMTDLRQARTEQVNRESAARLAKEKADAAAAGAQTSQDDAVQALLDAKSTFGRQQEQINALVAERDAAKARLDEARAKVAPATPAGPPATPAAQNAPSSPATSADAGWDKAPEGVRAPYGDISQWDTTIPMVPSAFVSGDPIAIVNAVLQISATSAQVTANMGRKFLQSIGILAPDSTGINNNGVIPRVYGKQAVEHVINRGMSQMGVPYSWGGGNANGPSYGIDGGSNTYGFDCSGLVLYAFAGVGIELPHYSGSQYNMGRQLPSSQMQRGDVIFYGPGGSQHVTIYLGNGQMLEAPYTGSHVKISPVRTAGMTPNVVRYIEW